MPRLARWRRTSCPIAARNAAAAAVPLGAAGAGFRRVLAFAVATAGAVLRMHYSACQCNCRAPSMASRLRGALPENFAPAAAFALDRCIAFLVRFGPRIVRDDNERNDGLGL